MATDIAFALGVLTLLGPRVPVGLKVFLTALAVVDDLGAVLVIAVFYTDTLHLVPLLVALGVVALLVLGNRLGVRSLAVYLVAGLVIGFRPDTEGASGRIGPGQQPRAARPASRRATGTRNGEQDT